MASQTVTLPLELTDRTTAALSTSADMVVALFYLADQQPQDEVMAAALCAVRACVEKLDRAIGGLAYDFPQAVKVATSLQA